MTPEERRLSLAIDHLEAAGLCIDYWRDGESDSPVEFLLAGIVHSQIASVALAMPDLDEFRMKSGLGESLLDSLAAGLVR